MRPSNDGLFTYLGSKVQPIKGVIDPFVSRGSEVQRIMGCN